MLEFAQKPPQSPDDISLSETGKVLLERASSWERMDALGQAACSEIIDALGGIDKMAEIEEGGGFIDLSQRLVDQAAAINNDNLHPFINGMTSQRITLRRSEAQA